MKRTKLIDRLLPDYTNGEEVFNMVSHIVGGGLGILYLVLCVIVSALHHNTWGVAALATIFTAIDLKKYSKLSMLCYIGMGWCIVIAIKPLLQVMPLAGFYLLLAGGIVYTIGAILYGIGTKCRYMHSVFHLFVLAGSTLQALCILLYVL